MEYQQIPESIAESESEPEPDDPNDSDYVPVSSSGSEEVSPKFIHRTKHFKCCFQISKS